MADLPEFDEATLFPAKYAFEDEEWDKAAAMDAAMRFPRMGDRVISAMWVHQHSLERESRRFARLKTDYEHVRARKVLELRTGGEKSGEVAKMTADLDPDVYVKKVQFLTAEQLIKADREALKILHARLDDLRTQAADNRAAGAWQGRDHA